MSELKRNILFFCVLLVVFIGCILVMPTDTGKILMSAVAALTLYSIGQKILQLWREQ